MKAEKRIPFSDEDKVFIKDPNLQMLYQPKATSPSVAPIEYNASMFSLLFYTPSFHLAPLFAPLLGHEYQLWNHYGDNPMFNLNVAQEPSIPISSQTSNDLFKIQEGFGVNQTEFPSASVLPFSQTSSDTTTASDIDISFSPIPFSGAMKVNGENKGEEGIESIPESDAELFNSLFKYRYHN